MIILHSAANMVRAVTAEPAPGHLHQGGILISRGGTNHFVCVCVWGGGGGGGVGWEACNL